MSVEEQQRVRQAMAESKMKRFSYYVTLMFHVFLRKKTVDEEHLQDTKLSRCLNALDLTALGIGSTLGAGVYVIAGQVAHMTTGPAVIFSFLVAAAASALAGLCYAEFGARVPKSGSAYVYSYVSVGELMAFVIGWNLILEYVIGTASVARAWSQNFDSLISNRISTVFKEHMTMNLPGLAEYPDFFAFGITMLLTFIVAAGVKESAWVTKIFTLMNLSVLATVVISGLWLVDFDNWRVVPGPNGTAQFGNETFSAEMVGSGGFLPFGPGSIIRGAGTCFYAFIGFDAIATTGEEVKNPQKAIPISILLSLAICFLAYFSLSTVLTMIVPYFALDKNTPLPLAFEAKGWSVTNYIIAVGAVCALSTSMLGAMIPLPRIVYAMGCDGLIFRIMSRVNKRVSTPLIATLTTGTMGAVMACMLELKDLVDMMSIGTLLAYTLVAVSVLILRGNEEDFVHPHEEKMEIEVTEHLRENGAASQDEIHVKDGVGHDYTATKFELPPTITAAQYVSMSFKPESSEPTRFSETVNRGNTFLYFLCSGILAFFTDRFFTYPGPGISIGLLVPLIIFLVLSIVIVVSLRLQPESRKPVAFKVPFVPFVPCLSIFVNLYLMMALSKGTWIRFLVWMAIGFAIYFFYGMFHSSEHELQTKKHMKGIKMAILLEEDRKEDSDAEGEITKEV